MSRFPLYDSLYKDIPINDLTLVQKKMFMKKILKIDMNGHEIIYALIKMYQVLNEENNMIALPYKGLYYSKDISFDLDLFPVSLKHILLKFIGVHIYKMKEEYAIEKQSNVKRL